MSTSILEDSTLKKVVPTRLCEHDYQALQDRAMIEGSTPTAVARQAIRHYLSIAKTVSPASHG